MGWGKEEAEAGAVGALQAVIPLCGCGHSRAGAGPALLSTLGGGQGRRKNKNMGSPAPGPWGLGMYSVYPSGARVCLDPEGSTDGK